MLRHFSKSIDYIPFYCVHVNTCTVTHLSAGHSPSPLLQYSFENYSAGALCYRYRIAAFFPLYCKCSVLYTVYTCGNMVEVSGYFSDYMRVFYSSITSSSSYFLRVRILYYTAFSVCTSTLDPLLSVLQPLYCLYSSPSAVCTPGLLRLYTRPSAVCTPAPLLSVLPAFCRLYSRPSAVYMYCRPSAVYIYCTVYTPALLLSVL